MFSFYKPTSNPALEAHQKACKLKTIELQYQTKIEQLQDDEQKCILEARKAAQRNDRQTAQLKAQHIIRLRSCVNQYQKMISHTTQLALNQEFASAHVQLMQQMNELANNETTNDFINGLPELYANVEQLTQNSQQNSVASEMMNEMMETMSTTTSSFSDSDNLVNQIFDELQIDFTNQLSAPSTVQTSHVQSSESVSQSLKKT